MIFSVRHFGPGYIAKIFANLEIFDNGGGGGAIDETFIDCLLIATLLKIALATVLLLGRLIALREFFFVATHLLLRWLAESFGLYEDRTDCFA